MSGLLAQLFVALGVTLTVGFVLGFTLGVRGRRIPDAERSPTSVDETPTAQVANPAAEHPTDETPTAQIANPAAEHPGEPATDHEPAAAHEPSSDRDDDLADAVDREAALIEALAKADDDLHARARELAIANEEITCLLEQLHEARRIDR